MYLEFLLVIADYISTLNKRILIYEWGLPILLGITSGILSFVNNNNVLYNIIQNSVPIIATLLGFTLAALTLFLTGNAKIEEAKSYLTDKKISGQPISLYRLVVVNYSYLILVETFLCISFYIASLFPYLSNKYVCMIANMFFIIAMFNTLFSTIRSITDLYFIIIKKEKKKR